MDVRDFEFSSQRFTIRHWRRLAADADAFIDVVLDLLTPAVRRTLPDEWQTSFTRGRARDWLAETGANLLVVSDRESMTPVAFLLIYESDETPGQRIYRIGYLVAEAAWGKGVATEMLEALVGYCKAMAPLTLLAGVESDNAASRRVLEKCGFADRREEPGDQRLYSLVIA